MEDMRDSTVVLQIVKIVRMVVKFHPLLIVTHFIFMAIFLHDWIEEEVRNQWKVLKVYCQLEMRALLDLITEKMKNLSEALQMHLHNEAANGQLKVKLIGKLAIFSAAFLLLDTKFSSKYDKRGAKVQLLLLIGLELLTRSKLWSQLQILHRRCSCVENSTSNFIFFILALVFAKFYDNSLRTLSSILCISVYLLCLLVVLRPRTDLGLFSFIIGVIGSITYNCYEFKFPTWIIAFISFVLFSFKSWLDKYWLNLEQNPSTNTTARSTSMILILLPTTVFVAHAFLVTSAVRSPLSNYKDWLVRAISGMIWTARLNKVYPKDSSLTSTNTKGIRGLILIVINVAQGMFTFAFTISPVGNYKYWLFATISYVVFFFLLCRFLSNDLSLPSTNAKCITSIILFLRSIATCDIVVLSGSEPSLYHDWLVEGIFCVLWWVRLRIVISQRSPIDNHI